jgi:F420-dependent oxidoreductase-like protein
MRRLWKFADAGGFDWFSVSDHFQESPPRGGDMDCYEAIATLTAAAMDTTRVRLGSGVYCVAYRNPGLLAKSLTTIDHLSNGRVECGLGAGWHDDEARAFGIPFPSIGPREDMLEEYAQIMRLLLDPEQPRSNFQGKHFQVSNAPNNPKPLQPRIPIWIGGRGEKRTLRIVAEHADEWNVTRVTFDEYTAKRAVLERHCAAVKRDPATIARSLMVPVIYGRSAAETDTRRAKAKAIFPRIPDDAAAWRAAGFLYGGPDEIARDLKRWDTLGIHRVLLQMLDMEDLAAIEAIAKDVLPAVR